MNSIKRFGFTLLELSIVLVIIGLIVGGILVGRDLISSSEIRAQISQIERYNTAAMTFKAKFNALPGDIDNVNAAQLGFTTTGCSGGYGQRNNNGEIESVNSWQVLFGAYENSLFWNDLSSPAAGNLIEGVYPGAVCSTVAAIAASNVKNYLPSAKLGTGNWIYTFGGSLGGHKNWFGLSYFQTVTNIGENFEPSITGVGLTVMQAYSIDAKIDDALPQTGGVKAIAVRQGSLTAAPNAMTSDATTCYSWLTRKYSNDYNGGNGVNCFLSFKMN